jgi:hypothetical protein
MTISPQSIVISEALEGVLHSVGRNFPNSVIKAAKTDGFHNFLRFRVTVFIL